MSYRYFPLHIFVRFFLMSLISEVGKYTSYCTRNMSHAITITYYIFAKREYRSSQGSFGCEDSKVLHIFS